MISLDDIDADDQREWTKALADAEAFLPEARKVYKAETGKACNNFAMAQVLAKFARALSQPVGAGEGFVPAGWQYRECHAWDTDKPGPWSGWKDCGPVMLERIRSDSQFDGRVHELRQVFAAPTPPAAEDARDAARYRWWRDHAGEIADDTDGLLGIAFSHQIDVISRTWSTPELMDAIADAAMLTSPDSGKEGV